jgi:jumonji domain-containing protein 7
MLLHPNIDDAVPYLSSQNDNLRVQFEQLSSSIPETIYLAQDAFGQSEPEAVNLWIGDHRSISSLHKDHFEVVYVIYIYS